MNIKKIIGCALSLACLSATCNIKTQTDTIQNLTRYVDPYIGTGGHGHVFLGTNVPFGQVQLGPTNITGGWDWTSGYHISDSTIWGFTHMHLSGTGIGDLLDIAVMPVVGDVKLGKGIAGDPGSGMYSLFSRDKEIARAGFYAVHLDRYNIGVELTATKRVGFHKYIFPESTESKVVIDLKSHLNWDGSTDTYLIQENDTVISGYRFSKGWANDQRIFFTAVFSKPMKQFILSDGEEQKNIKGGRELRATGVYGQALFDTKDKEEIYIKVALSPVSIDGARRNLEAELPGWDFSGTVRKADQAWNSELNKIQIESGDQKVLRTFYTALYHTMIAPSEFCDVDGSYMGTDKKIYVKAPFVNYTTFSLWDTYRAAHPLMSIIHPEKVDDVISSMLAIYQQQGKLPVWHLMGCETDCMVGNPAIPVVADAMLKGFRGFDRELAYEAMKTSAMLDERGLGLYKKYGYIPFDKYNESVATCLEYALADWALAQVALQNDKKMDYQYFNDRSKAYKYYFDKETHFLRGLSSEGKWRTPFNPFQSTHREDDYTEGNAWQYTWLVPHDIEGLMGLFGSRENFHQKLDSLFTVEGNMGEGASPDISGLIGQYAHGNEPSHHVLYLYTMTGQPWKTASLVRQVLSELYHDKPDGLSGNEDVGQMSAWYVLSALGMYQVEPAGGRYYFGSPIIDKAALNVGNGKEFMIIAQNNSEENKYIQSIKLNGKPYKLPYITFGDIQKGGKLELEMGIKQVVWSK